jgi:hypothetical protein
MVLTEKLNENLRLPTHKKKKKKGKANRNNLKIHPQEIQTASSPFKNLPRFVRLQLAGQLKDLLPRQCLVCLHLFRVDKTKEKRKMLELKKRKRFIHTRDKKKK